MQYRTKTLLVAVCDASIPAALLVQDEEARAVSWLLTSLLTLIVSWVTGLKSRSGPAWSMGLFGLCWFIITGIGFGLRVEDREPWETPDEHVNAFVMAGLIGGFLFALPVFGLIGALSGWIATAWFGMEKTWQAPQIGPRQLHGQPADPNHPDG